MSGSNETVRIGMVGAGGIVAQRHHPGLSKVDGVELVSVCNSTPESSQRAAATFSIPTTYANWRDLVAADDTNAILIGTQPYLHRAITVAALDAGKHVFCQARMAMDYQDAKRMYERALASDRTTMLCPPPHYMRGDTVIRNLIRQGYVGPIYNVVIRSYLDSYSDASTPLHWRQIGRVSGVNTLDLGMMAEVLHRWLGYTQRVSAQTRTFVTERDSPAGNGRATVDRPDTVSVVAELENGALATMLLSGMARAATDRNAFEVYGANGALRYDFAADTIYGLPAGADEWQVIPVSDAEARPWSAEADWVEAIRTGQWGSPSFWDGLKYMEFTEAVVRSAETGRAQVLPFDALEQPARARAAIGM